jgi:hypothetical protein
MEGGEKDDDNEMGEGSMLEMLLVPVPAFVLSA